MDLKADEKLNMNTKIVWLKDITFALDYLHLHLQSHKKVYPKY